MVPTPTAGQISCSMVSVLLRRVRATMGERGGDGRRAGPEEGGDRLHLTAGMRDRLAGVAAQAATALDNARLLETIAHQASHDSLTGLLGRRAFHETLRARLGERDSRPLTLALIDIDDFKRVNDAHGHPAGDQALVVVAEALRAAVREEDLVFRIGGEEFAVILCGLDGAHALGLAERLRAGVAAAPSEPGLTVSVGLASWPLDAPDAGTLIERADAGLYASKRAGKDRVTLLAA